MKWTRGHRSDDVEVRTGNGRGGALPGGVLARTAWFKRGYASGNPEASDTMEQARR